jgi:hypothetical protein
MVGDGVNDIVAGHRAGCRTIWIGRWKCETCQAFRDAKTPSPAVAGDLYEAARHIITQGEEHATVPRLG